MKKIKKLLLFVCVLTCIFALTACGGSKKEKPSFDYTESDLVSVLTSNTETVAQWDSKTLDAAIEDYDDSVEPDATLKSGLEQFKASVEEAGKFVGFYLDADGNAKYSISTKKDAVTIKAKAQYKERDVNITYVFGMVDKELSITSITYEAKYSLGEKMEKAALNTVMGIVTVIAVLFFLSILISLFVYIGKAQKAIENKRNNKNKTAIDEIINQIAEKEEQEESDDTELVAVITAAIAASENTSGDGFVVRSIKRVSNRNWK